MYLIYSGGWVLLIGLSCTLLGLIWGYLAALISWDNPMAPSLRQQPLITGLVLAVGWVCCT